MKTITTVGKYEAVLKLLDITHRALEEQAIEIEEKDKTIGNLQRALAEERVSKKKPRPNLHVVEVYQFPTKTGKE